MEKERTLNSLAKFIFKFSFFDSRLISLCFNISVYGFFTLFNSKKEIRFSPRWGFCLSSSHINALKRAFIICFTVINARYREVAILPI